MALEAELRNVLEAVCPRVYPDAAPPLEPTPYAVWQQFGGGVINYTDDSVPDTENAFVQVTVWANTRIEADALMRRIEAAMIVAAPFTARPMGALVSAFSEDDGYRGCHMDFDVWMRR